MNYLKKYGITDEQINEIELALMNNDVNEDIFLFDSDKIEEILNLFISIGVNNIFDIIVTSPSMFCDTVGSIKKRIQNYGNTSELAMLLNDNAANLILADLM